MSNLQLIPPEFGKCCFCAVEHEIEQPHDATSFYYRFRFSEIHGRSATWADAMAHCESEVKEGWTKHLNRIGIDINSTQVKGDITSKEELEARLKST